MRYWLNMVKEKRKTLGYKKYTTIGIYIYIYIYTINLSGPTLEVKAHAGQAHKPPNVNGPVTQSGIRITVTVVTKQPHSSIAPMF